MGFTKLYDRIDWETLKWHCGTEGVVVGSDYMKTVDTLMATMAYNHYKSVRLFEKITIVQPYLHRYVRDVCCDDYDLVKSSDYLYIEFGGRLSVLIGCRIFELTDYPNKDCFKPVYIYGLPIDENLYYSFDLFSPVKVAVSLLRGRISRDYVVWLKEYIECVDTVLNGVCNDNCDAMCFGVLYTDSGARDKANLVNRRVYLSTDYEYLSVDADIFKLPFKLEGMEYACSYNGDLANIHIFPNKNCMIDTESCKMFKLDGHTGYRVEPIVPVKSSGILRKFAF